MTMENLEQYAYQRARKRARSIRGFYSNLLCYCIVVPFLAAINLIYSPEFWWFLLSAVGWGIGLAFHAMEVFEFHPFFGRNWQERKIQEILSKENQLNKK